MPVRSLLVATGLVLAALAVPAVAAPNIIYILADDLGVGELGCYGQKIIRTPNLDRLAAEGMRFTEHYSGSAVCAPARCMLLTGLHSGHAAIRGNSEVKPEGQRPLPREAVTIAELLKERGYATAAIGKWGLGMFGTSGDPNQQGFDLFYGYNCQRHAHDHYPSYLWRNDRREPLDGTQYTQDLFVAEAKRFLREHQEGPFFLYLPFAVPHLSIQVPDASAAPYREQIEEVPYKHTAYEKHPTPRAGYAGMVTHMDQGIGEILELVEQLGLDDNTLILFSSDNGPAFDRLGGTDSDYFHSAAGRRGRKGSLYEGGIRVPLIARWPGRIAPGTTSDHLSAFQDVLPTLCEVAGANVPEKIDGISFAATLLGQPGQQQHEHLYWEFASYGSQQAVRKGPWKAVRQNLARGNRHTELYHLGDDPAESNDLSAEHPEQLARLIKIMQREHVPNLAFPLPGIDTATGGPKKPPKRKKQ